MGADTNVVVRARPDDFTLDPAHTAVIEAASSALTPIGFSQRTCFPALRAARVMSWCAIGGVATAIASRGWATTPSARDHVASHASWGRPMSTRTGGQL